MGKLNLDLQNCYGIKKMNEEIDFSKNNVAIIYAQNGMMKSSLAKTFQAIRDGNKVEERIFNNESSYNIYFDNSFKFSSDNLIVVNPFEESIVENQNLLMANDELRMKYSEIHKELNFKEELIYNQIKAKIILKQKKDYNDIKKIILRDFGFSSKDEFELLIHIRSLLDIPELECLLDENNLNYSLLFDEKVNSIFKNQDTIDLIELYEEKYKELVEKSLYMKSGVIDHNNYNKIGKELNENGFFKANNEIILNAKDGSISKKFKDEKELNEFIEAEKNSVLNSEEIKKEFEKINNELNKNKGIKELNSFLQDNQEIIIEYKDIELFKKKIWVKAFETCRYLLDDFIESYNKSNDKLKELKVEAQKQETDWKNAIDLFKERFFVPFRIEASNQEDVILRQEMPSFKYIFSDCNGEKEVTKESLLDVISTGERRAFYILNIIFKILIAKKQEQECFIVLDDISESFDYKNKYAIIEYIKDISEYTDSNGKKLFKILLLTHNFDFYRTVGSRIATPNNSYIAQLNSGEIKLEKGHYTKKLFLNNKNDIFKNNKLNEKIMIASIPVVRNLIEYTEGSSNNDYLTLTSILHYKDDTKSITLKDIEEIFNKHWLKNNCNLSTGRENELIYDILMHESEKIQDTETIEINNKLILSMAIRLKAEEYIQNRIKSEIENGKEVIEEILENNNQMRELLNKYKEFINDENVRILESVNIITPQNIHFNSFMFEPILDTSIKELYKTYNEIKKLF